MLKIGLTGGIGSGKSVVADLLGVMGVPVYDSDSRSKQLCDTDDILKSGLMSLFGEKIYNDGVLNRSLLAERIFKDENALKSVNELIHPAVVRDFMSWIGRHVSSPLVVQETAILFEAGLSGLYDYIISVTAPESIRINRVYKRSGLLPEEVGNRMKNQINDEERVRLSDFVIINDGSKSLIKQVEKIIEEIGDKQKLS
jgi:dephospho-CoA kinase